MPHYLAPDGSRFYFETAPDPEHIRADLVLMTDAEVAAADAPAPVVPEAVTMRQARLALLGAGLLSSVDAAIDGLPSPMREAARIDWEYASEVRRDSPLIVQMGAPLGLDDAQIDALFVAAASL